MDPPQTRPSTDYAIMVAISIGVLTFIFLCALLGLLYICRRHQRRTRQTKRWSRFDDDRSGGRTPKAQKKPGSCARGEPELALALNDIGLGSALEQILGDEQWRDDASGCIPHCLAILRTCHALTERLADLAMRPLGGGGGGAGGAKRAGTARLIEATRRVPDRVDDVVHSMYPPFDLRLLEARLAALVLAVGQVALLTQSVSGGGAETATGGASAASGAVAKWIDEGLNDMDAHLLVLRKIAQQQLADEQSGQSRVYLSSSQV